MTEKFSKKINKAYEFEGQSIVLGAAMLDAEPLEGVQVKLPLKTLNRHGLISGATGTGKTKSIQTIAEKLSEQGIASLVMDMKGDLSGLSQEGKPHAKIDERADAAAIDWQATAYPVEFLSLSGKNGVKLRATVSEFGPILFSKMLGLNENQTGIVALAFKYADDNDIPLIDLKDFRKLLQFLTGAGKQEVKANYGNIATNSVGSILRKVVEIEGQGAKKFFGEKSFDIEDLMRINDEGMGYINLIRLNDIQDRPKLFSSFMLSLLAEIYQKLPEEGDLESPKLVLFIDEAHLIFKEASKELLSQLETIIKLIRSKGVGIFFCTQSPKDIPDEILGQLGMKVQHALRAFTAKDRQAIKLIAQNFPETEFYDVKTLLGELGIGEALITVINEKGRPTPLVQTFMTPPQSRMDTITAKELKIEVASSDLLDKYDEDIDRESAYEILSEKIAKAKELAEKEAAKPKKRKTTRMGLGELMMRQASRTVVSTVMRSLLGALMGGAVSAATGRRRKRKSSQRKSRSRVYA